MFSGTNALRCNLLNQSSDGGGATLFGGVGCDNVLNCPPNIMLQPFSVPTQNSLYLSNFIHIICTVSGFHQPNMYKYLLLSVYSVYRLTEVFKVARRARV